MKKRVLAALLAVCLLIGTGVTFALAKPAPGETYVAQGTMFEGDDDYKDTLIGQKYGDLQNLLTGHIVNDILTHYTIKPKTYDELDPNKPVARVTSDVKEITNKNVRDYFNITLDRDNSGLNDDAVTVTSTKIDESSKTVTVYFKFNGTKIDPNNTGALSKYVYSFKNKLADKANPNSTTADDKYIDCSNDLLTAADIDKVYHYAFKYFIGTNDSPADSADGSDTLSITIELRHAYTVYGIEGERFTQNPVGWSYGKLAQADRAEVNQEPDKITNANLIISPAEYTSFHIPFVTVDKEFKKLTNHPDENDPTQDDIRGYFNFSPALDEKLNEKVIIESNDFTKDSQYITITVKYDKDKIAEADLNATVNTLTKTLKDKDESSDNSKYEVQPSDVKTDDAFKLTWKYEDQYFSANKVYHEEDTVSGSNVLSFQIMRSAHYDVYGNEGVVYKTNLAGKKYIDVQRGYYDNDPDKKLEVVGKPEITYYTITPKEEAFTVSSDVTLINNANVSHYFNITTSGYESFNDTVNVFGVFGPYDETIKVNFTLKDPTKNGQVYYQISRKLKDTYDKNRDIYIDASETILKKRDNNVVVDGSNTIDYDYEEITNYRFKLREVNQSSGRWSTRTTNDSATYTLTNVKRTPQRDPIGHLDFTWNLWKNLKDLGKWIQGAFTFLLRTAWEPFRWVLSYIVDIRPHF